MSWLLSLAFAGDLEAAYQKEYAFLNAEKTTLEERLEEHQVEAQRRVQVKEAELDGLQGKLIRTTLRADDAEASLDDQERQTWSNEEDVDRIDALFSQAADAGLQVPETEDEGEKLRAVFSQAAEGLRDGGQVREGPGSFFDLQGTERTGTLVQFGEVAAYGIDGEVAGPLAPAGDGKLKLWEQDARIAEGVDGTLGVFLFEDLAKPIQERKEKTLDDILDGGGVVGWIILGLGALALVLGGVRLLILSGAGKATRRMVAAIQEQAGSPRNTLEDVAAEVVHREIPKLERFGSAILVIAAVAPLLGLLGTVTGMIATFDIITEFGTGDPKMLSGGISTALITTQLGLVVAIPAVLLGNALGARTEGVIAGLEQKALETLNQVASSPMSQQTAPMTTAPSPTVVAHAK